VQRAIEQLAAFEARGEGGQARRRYVLLDVFSERPLEGNQLAVFTDARGLRGEQMQRMARELRLSESVFALPAAGEGDVAIRIFTPAAELPFAGHPVLGAGVVLASALGRERVALETGMGAVEVRVRREHGRVVSGWMRQPLPAWSAYERADELLRALGVERPPPPASRMERSLSAPGLERSLLPIEIYDNGPRHVYVQLADPGAVAALRPDMQALAALGELCVSCFAGEGRHWRTRMFAPALGVSEDPATGSAAGPLALHLARHGRIAFGDEIEIAQGAEVGRPSLLYAFAAGSAARVERVEVGGCAVVVGRGELSTG
jgi:trans-2,3-dihydro-3-hydroxyanthranilate isomerase